MNDWMDFLLATHVAKKKDQPKWHWERYEENGEVCVRRVKEDPGYYDMDGNWFPTKQKAGPAPAVAENVYILEQPEPEPVEEEKPIMTSVPFADDFFGLEHIIINDELAEHINDIDDIVDPI